MFRRAAENKNSVNTRSGKDTNFVKIQKQRKHKEWKRYKFCIFSTLCVYAVLCFLPLFGIFTTRPSPCSSRMAVPQPLLVCPYYSIYCMSSKSHSVFPSVHNSTKKGSSFKHAKNRKKTKNKENSLNSGQGQFTFELKWERFTLVTLVFIETRFLIVLNS